MEDPDRSGDHHEGYLHSLVVVSLDVDDYVEDRDFREITWGLDDVFQWCDMMVANSGEFEELKKKAKWVADEIFDE